ncbi:putative protein M01D1.5 [Paratrimastix pyriformis]|uniref:TRAF-type domain-containing protein n=1 Tax=Paratrimastix pyriformis TaxID=342808 RepID=A0ABQ8U5M5_9EUKA|nr:putative protein M01D1.5 [Paratrimastix pyriformis]
MVRMGVCHGYVCHGYVCHGYVCHGYVCHGYVCHGYVCHGYVCHGYVCHGYVCHGYVCHGYVCHGYVCHGYVCHGYVCHGYVCHGYVCHGYVCHGYVCHGYVCHGYVCHGYVCVMGMCVMGMFVMGMCVMGMFVMGMFVMGMFVMGMCVMGMCVMGMCVMGMFVMGMCVMGMCVMGMCVMGMFVMGMCVMGMFVMGMFVMGMFVMGMCVMGMCVMGMCVMDVDILHLSMFPTSLSPKCRYSPCVDIPPVHFPPLSPQLAKKQIDIADSLMSSDAVSSPCSPCDCPVSTTECGSFLEYIDPPPNAALWKCPVCEQHLEDPVVLQCVTLLRDIWRQVTIFIPVPGVEWMVREIKVRCPHHIPGAAGVLGDNDDDAEAGADEDEGLVVVVVEGALDDQPEPAAVPCEAVVTVGTLEAHLAGECPAQRARCPQCGRAVARAERAAHLAERCPGRRVACPKCTQPVAARELMQSETGARHLRQECPRRLRACRKGCGQRVPLADMEEHCRRDCPNKPRRIPAGVTNDDGQSCAYAATVQLLAGLRLRAPAQSRRRFGATPVLEPGPLRVDKCSCGGQLRELSAVKPAPVLVVTVDKLAGVIARAFKTGRLEREGWPSFRLVGAEAHWLPTTGHETAIFRTNDGALFDLSGTRRTEVTTSDVEEGLRLLVFVVERDVTTAATLLKAAPGQQLRRPPPSRLTTKRHCPPRLLHPPQQHHRPRQHGPAGRPREQLLAPPVDRPASPADVSPSPSDQATTNTPEEEHQDHTGAPLNHNRPRSSEDFVIFYPGAARRWTRGPSPSLRAEAESAMQTATRKAMWAKSTAERLGIRVEARRRRHTPGTPTGDTDRPATGRGGPFELYFPDGAPDGLTPAPTAVRTSREGQAWAVFSSLEDATAARAGASTRVAWSKATAARLNLPPEATSPRLPQAPSTKAASPRGIPPPRPHGDPTDLGTGGGSPTPEERPSQNCATDPPRDARTSEHSPTDKRHGLPPRPYSSFPTACPWPSSPLPMAAPFATKSGTTDKSGPVPGPPAPATTLEPATPSQCAAATSCLHLSRQAPNTPTGPPRHTSMEGKVPTLYLLSDRRRHVYVGTTVNLTHRVLQHNGLLAGGAQQTQGHRWHLLAACWGPAGADQAAGGPPAPPGLWLRLPQTRHRQTDCRGPLLPSSLASSSTVLTCILSPRSAPTSPRP